MRDCPRILGSFISHSDCPRTSRIISAQSMTLYVSWTTSGRDWGLIHISRGGFFVVSQSIKQYISDQPSVISNCMREVSLHRQTTLKCKTSTGLVFQLRGPTKKCHPKNRRTDPDCLLSSITDCFIVSLHTSGGATLTKGFREAIKALRRVGVF